MNSAALPQSDLRPPNNPTSNPAKMIDTSWRGDTIRRGNLKNIEGGESWLKVCP